MFRVARTVCSAVVLLAMVPSVAARAGERRVREADVPAAVREAAKKRYPEGHLVGYIREDERGEVTFEVTVRIRGRSTDLRIATDGRILVVEEQIARSDLPVAVAKALAASPYGRDKIVRVERIVEGDKTYEPHFAILVKRRDGFVELTFVVSGILIKEERMKRAD